MSPTREDLEAIMNGPHRPSYQVKAGSRVRTVKSGRKDPVPAGYANIPGTGPKGETCRTCRNLVRVEHARTYLKCGLNRAAWTGGRKTDVLANSPACSRWAAELEPGDDA